MKGKKLQEKKKKKNPPLIFASMQKINSFLVANLNPGGGSPMISQLSAASTSYSLSKLNRMLVTIA